MDTTRGTGVRQHGSTSDSPQSPSGAAGPRQEAAYPPAIDLRDVGIVRDGRWILRHVNWSVPQGACVAILGPNGSGKSTMTRVIGTHWWPSEGRAAVLGGRFGEANLLELRQKIRLVQPAGPYDIDPALTAREAVLTGFFSSIALYQTPTSDMAAEADRLLRLVGLTPVANHVYQTLSSGEKVRTLLARAMALKPRLLLLDEPTNGLDLLAREQVLATVEQLLRQTDPPTVVIITHHVEELPPATCDVVLLCQGVVAMQGPPERVLREEVLSRVYGFPVQVRTAGGRYYLEVHPRAWEQLLKPS